MQLRDLVPSLTRYNSAIRGCIQEKEWQMAVSLVLGAFRNWVCVCPYRSIAFPHHLIYSSTYRDATDVILTVQPTISSRRGGPTGTDARPREF